MSLRARRVTVPATPWQRCPQGRQHTEMQLWDLFFCTVSAIPFWVSPAEFIWAPAIWRHNFLQEIQIRWDSIFMTKAPHSWTTNMSFSFYVRLIRKHDGTAKRNQMRQFACQDIVDLETYDLRTCGVASAEIMFKIKSCSNPITYMRNAFDVLHGVLMKKIADTYGQRR